MSRLAQPSFFISATILPPEEEGDRIKTMATKKQKLVLIDAHALIHRAYHALPPMSTKTGQPTNAVYGFVTTLFKVFTSLKPTHVVAAFDMKGPTFRHALDPNYKAHRVEIDQALIDQFEVVREVVKAFNIPIINKAGFEADDIIGTLTKQVKVPDKIIVTGDMDALQLVDEHTTVFTLKRTLAETVTYTVPMVEEKYGFGPELVTDYKGLRGDASDNIPGVEGIGEKTAKELVGKYGTIENIFKHLDELPNRAQTRLRGHKKEALDSRHLATIVRDVPIKFSLDDAELADYDVEKVRSIFEKLEFHSLLNRLPKSKHGQEIQPTLLGTSPLTLSSREERGDDEHSETRSEVRSSLAMPKNYHLVESAAEQKKLLATLMKEKVVAFDTENDKLGARTYPIVGMSFSNGKDSWYVPVTRESVKAWKPLLESEKVQKVGHNLKYDWQVLAQSGITLRGIVFDSMIASYLLHPDGRQHGLDPLAAELLGHHTIPITALIGDGPTSPRLRGASKEQKLMSQVPLQDIAVYAAEDADIAWRLYQHFLPHLKEQKLMGVLEDIEVPLIPVLADMEMAGVSLDTTVLAGLSKKLTKRITKLRADIQGVAGEEFNVNSTLQLRRVLYEKLLLPTDGIARTQSGYSTAASELAKLRGKHEIIGWLEEYRELTKLLSTYISTLPELVDAEDKRLHTSFNQVVAATGRLSSQDPNLQNIPVRTETGQEIRAAFVAAQGYQLIKADYSQLELRIVAHMAEDKAMLEAFRRGADIHIATAAQVFGVALDAVTPKQRRHAKTLNFGVLYGMGARNFAQAADVSVEEARSFIERYERTYTGIVAFRAEILAQANELGYVETLFGRRRPVPEIKASSPGIRAAAERYAFNTPVQGTAADIIKKAMLGLHAHMKKEYPKAKLVLTVHDELVAEVPVKEVATFAADMKRIMEGVTTLDVPLIVEVAAGPNWRDTEEIT
jgi:DNA polymerase-1